MKLGLITDVHEQIEFLQIALDRFRAENVDQIVVIGDLFEIGERIEETCRLLAEAETVGVWGNHDYGLSVDPSSDIRVRFPFATDYMTTLHPRLEVGGCYFAHVEPWLDPEDITDLWFFEGPPDSAERLDRIFGAVPNRLIFAGHYHRWLLASPNGIAPWKGDCPVRLNDERYFVVVGALSKGQFAILDTNTSELVPCEA